MSHPKRTDRSCPWHTNVLTHWEKRTLRPRLYRTLSGAIHSGLLAPMEMSLLQSGGEAWCTNASSDSTSWLYRPIRGWARGSERSASPTGTPGCLNMHMLAREDGTSDGAIHVGGWVAAEKRSATNRLRVLVCSVVRREHLNLDPKSIQSTPTKSVNNVEGYYPGAVEAHR